MAQDTAAATGKLKLYVDLVSQPNRAVTIFCRANNMGAEEVKIELARTRHTRTPEFQKLNPMGLIPFIEDDGFKLFESHAILRYLATSRNVADHWYPKDLKKRALIDAALDWHHLNLRRWATQLIQRRVLAKLPILENFYPEGDNDALAEEATRMLPGVIDQLESMLQNGKFLQNSDAVSIADVSLVCELTQLKLLDIEEEQKLLGSRKRITTWMADVEEATNPHFAEVHTEIYGFCNVLHK